MAANAAYAAYLGSQIGANSEVFPRSGTIPGTIEHRGELEIPSADFYPPSPDGNCIERAFDDFEKWLDSATCGDDDNNCLVKLISDIDQCRNDDDNSWNGKNDWLPDNFDGPNLESGG